MSRSILVLALGFSAILSAQTAAQPPDFEVVSIKLGDPLSGHSGTDIDHDLMVMTNVSLKLCIMDAYHVGPNQIVGGPGWLAIDRYVISARAGQLVGDQIMMRMLQSLLADRFKLAIHHETRTAEAYVLEVAKGGSKMEKTESQNHSTESSRGRLDARATSMDLLAEELSRQMDLPVVNQTKLEGVFDFTLKWRPENAAASPESNSASANDARPSIFTALQEQLGLRVRATKAPVEVLVIDHAEHPTVD